MLKSAVTVLGFFSAVSGKVRKAWMDSSENNTGIATFSVNHNLYQDALREYGFTNQEMGVIRDDQIRLNFINVGANFGEFEVDDIFPANEFREKNYKTDQNAVEETFNKLQRGFFLRMPNYQSLELEENKYIKSPTEDGKTVLIKYSKTAKKLNFYVIEGYTENQIILTKTYSVPASPIQVKNVIKHLTDPEGWDNIPLTYKFVNPKSGQIEELEMTTVVTKEYQDKNGRYSLQDLKNLTKLEDQKRRNILSNLNKLVKQMGPKLERVNKNGKMEIDPIAKEVIDQINQHTIGIAKATTDEELHQIAKELEKIPKSSSFKQLKIKYKQVINILKGVETTLAGIVEKLKSVHFESQPTLGPSM